jgi:hypothetical protein
MAMVKCRKYKTFSAMQQVEHLVLQSMERLLTLEALSLIDEVSILFNNGKTSGCAPFDDESAGATDLADAIDSALEASDTIQQDGVVVAAVDLVQGGHEKILSIRWQR